MGKRNQNPKIDPKKQPFSSVARRTRLQTDLYITSVAEKLNRDKKIRDRESKRSRTREVAHSSSDVTEQEETGSLNGDFVVIYSSESDDDDDDRAGVNNNRGSRCFEPGESSSVSKKKNGERGSFVESDEDFYLSSSSSTESDDDEDYRVYMSSTGLKRAPETCTDDNSSSFTEQEDDSDDDYDDDNGDSEEDDDDDDDIPQMKKRFKLASPKRGSVSTSDEISDEEEEANAEPMSSDECTIVAVKESVRLDDSRCNNDGDSDVEFIGETWSGNAQSNSKDVVAVESGDCKNVATVEEVKEVSVSRRLHRRAAYEIARYFQKNKRRRARYFAEKKKRRAAGAASVNVDETEGVVVKTGVAVDTGEYENGAAAATDFLMSSYNDDCRLEPEEIRSGAAPGAPLLAKQSGSEKDVYNSECNQDNVAEPENMPMQDQSSFMPWGVPEQMPEEKTPEKLETRITWGSWYR